VGVDQPSQQHFVDTAAEPNLPVNFYDRHAGVEFAAEVGIDINIDQLGAQPVVGEQLLGLIAEMASLACVED
jgi:hypothetical protein